jgi:hypothetical protein
VVALFASGFAKMSGRAGIAGKVQLQARSRAKVPARKRTAVVVGSERTAKVPP